MFASLPFNPCFSFQPFFNSSVLLVFRISAGLPDFTFVLTWPDVPVIPSKRKPTNWTFYASKTCFFCLFVFWVRDFVSESFRGEQINISLCPLAACTSSRGLKAKNSLNFSEFSCCRILKCWCKIQETNIGSTPTFSAFCKYLKAQFRIHWNKNGLAT